MGKGDKLEYSLRHQTRTDTTLYDHCIQEFDSIDNQVGLDWVIFSYKCAFSIESIEQTFSLKGKQRGWWETNADNETEVSASETKTLFAKLRPYSFPSRYAPNYSLFGTDRVIEDFYLHIWEDKTENCWVTCTPEGYGVDDCLEIHLSLTSERFNSLVLGVSTDSLKNAFLQLDMVPGFYSNWTPDSRSDTIKVLSHEDIHEVDQSDQPESGVLLRCGEPVEYTIQWSSASFSEEAETEIDWDLEREEIERKREEELSGFHRLGDIFIAKFGSKLQSIENLKVPLWIICILLLVDLLI